MKAAGLHDAAFGAGQRVVDDERVFIDLSDG